MLIKPFDRLHSHRNSAKGLPMLGIATFGQTKITRLRDDSRGVTSLEYGVLAAGIVGIVAAAAIALGGNVRTLFTAIGALLVVPAA
jgi:Flp pilus assembly pilin Flp